MTKSNNLLLTGSLFLVTSFGISTLLTSFTYENTLTQVGKGNIEGYVFPKEAKAHIEIVLPKLNHEVDTIHRKINPNSGGYFKLQNIPAGRYELIYWPNDARYTSMSQMITVVAEKTAKAETVTLKKY